MKILILGGTSEGRELAGRLSGDDNLSVVVSLAGRTQDPVDQGADVMTGGFGGVDGLFHYLRTNTINLLVDATHPFAGAISRNANEAARRAAIPLLRIERPQWARMPGDRWMDVASDEEAIAALGVDPRRVFLAIGRQHVPTYLAAPQHFYLVRSIEPVQAIERFPRAEQILARGPFVETDELALLRGHAIEIMVTKNSGGDATAAKIGAARTLGLPVIMIGKPAVETPNVVTSVDEAIECVARIRRSAGY